MDDTSPNFSATMKQARKYKGSYKAAICMELRSQILQQGEINWNDQSQLFAKLIDDFLFTDDGRKAVMVKLLSQEEQEEEQQQ